MKDKELRWVLEVLKATENNSTCGKYKVAAIIVKDGRIISTGWNGTPSGLLECIELENLISIAKKSIESYNNFKLEDFYTFKYVKYILEKYNNSDKFNIKEIIDDILNKIKNNEKVENFIHSKYEIHAEMNAIAFAARHSISTNNAELVCSYKPCLECAKIIIQSGIKRVYYTYDYIDKRFSETSDNFLKLSGVELINVNL